MATMLEIEVDSLLKLANGGQEKHEAIAEANNVGGLLGIEQKKQTRRRRPAQSAGVTPMFDRLAEAISDEAIPAADDLVSGDNNTCVGYQAGFATTTGGGSVSVGHLAGFDDVTDENEVDEGEEEIQLPAPVAALQPRSIPVERGPRAIMRRKSTALPPAGDSEN